MSCYWIQQLLLQKYLHCLQQVCVERLYKHASAYQQIYPDYFVHSSPEKKPRPFLLMTWPGSNYRLRRLITIFHGQHGDWAELRLPWIWGSWGVTGGWLTCLHLCEPTSFWRDWWPWFIYENLVSPVKSSIRCPNSEWVLIMLWYSISWLPVLVL